MTETADHTSGRTRTLIVYGLMIAATVVAYLVIRHVGEQLQAPAPAPGSGFGSAISLGQVNALMHVLLALVVVIVMARAVGSLFARLHQPPVIGEILAGIMLGPSVLGRLSPAASAFVLPTSVAPFLGVLSQVGVILYMFLVGLELDPRLLRKRGHATVAISHASIIAPFLLGTLLALKLYPRLSSSDVPFTCFSLFLGVSMSVTAFPVLARILTDRRMHRSRMGVIALTCAAVDDVTAWCLLALVVSVVQARAAGAVLTFGLALGFIAVMIVLVRPAMTRLALLYGTRGRLTQGVMALLCVALLMSALATELIGIHAVFGAFALGAVIPHDSGMARELTERLEDLVVVLLLPAFFAFTGMRTQIGLVSGASQWALCGVIILVASVGKFGGSLVAARLTGLRWRDASALGILMNTRGLMELIVLNIGLELGVISPTLFAMLVLMAVTTTLATTPILHLITSRAGPERAAAALDQMRPEPRRSGILVPLANPEGLVPLVNLALAATRPDEPPPRALALVRRQRNGIRSGLREVEQRDVPRAAILTQALDHARNRGARLDGHALWTDDPAADILRMADQEHASWIIIGFHRPVFGHDARGGVVKAVLERAAGQPAHVAIVIHRHDRKLERLFAVVDHSRDGRAALELATRLGQQRDANLQVIVVPREGIEPEPELTALLKEAGRRSGRWLHTDVLSERSQFQLAFKTVGDLVIIGASLADQLGLPLDLAAPGDDRCVVVVQGGTQPTLEDEAAEEPASAVVAPTS
ncbi:MAG TPA: cation:proton antiporter [Polyangia bacterium]|nr:cation:proton antiporter [Polyangia bacterium]